MPLIHSSLGFVGFGASKQDAVTAAGAAVEMWQLASTKFDGVSVYLESGYRAFLDSRLTGAKNLLLKAQKATSGVTFFGPMVEEAQTSLAIAKAVVEQFKQVNDAVLTSRPPMRGAVKVPNVLGEDASVLSPTAAIALAVAVGGLIILATYKGAKAVKSRFRR